MALGAGNLRIEALRLPSARAPQSGYTHHALSALVPYAATSPARLAITRITFATPALSALASAALLRVSSAKDPQTAPNCLDT